MLNKFMCFFRPLVLLAFGSVLLAVELLCSQSFGSFLVTVIAFYLQLERLCYQCKSVCLSTQIPAGNKEAQP